MTEDREYWEHHFNQLETKEIDMSKNRESREKAKDIEAMSRLAMNRAWERFKESSHFQNRVVMQGQAIRDPMFEAFSAGYEACRENSGARPANPGGYISAGEYFAEHPSD